MFVNYLSKQKENLTLKRTHTQLCFQKDEKKNGRFVIVYH